MKPSPVSLIPEPNDKPFMFIRTIPAKPTMQPIVFRTVIFSLLNMKDAMIIAINTFAPRITDAFTPDVFARPM